MWADAQRDGCPAEHRWHPLFNATKFGWCCSLLDCRAVMLPRSRSRWNLQGTGKLISAAIRPKFIILWGHVEDILLLNKFFPIVDTFHSCEDSPTKLCDGAQMAIFGDFFLRPVFSASRLQQVSDLHLKFALRPHHVWKYGRHPIWGGWD